MWRIIFLVLAVLCLLAAAFKVSFGTEHVVWLYLGLMFWCASFLPVDGIALPKRKRAE